MFLLRVFLMAFRGLQANLMRSLLATLGVIIGVAAVVAAMSILEGAQKELRGRFESLGADQLYINAKSGQRQARNIVLPSLTIRDAEALSDKDNCPLITLVAPEYSFSETIKYFKRNMAVTILSTTPEYAEINEYDVVEGRFISAEDLSGERKVCVLGHKVAKELFGDAPATGQQVRIRGIGFNVIGVMEKKGFLMSGQADERVIIPLTTGMQRLVSSKYVQFITVKCESAAALEQCTQQIETTLRKTHNLRPGEESNFDIFGMERVQAELNTFKTLFSAVLGSIAGISLVVGGIGIMNIMLVSVTERTREIGVRMAVGARRADILKQFLIEANVISLLGGGLGILLGLVFTHLLKTTTQVLKPFTSISIVFWALAMAVLVGIASGLYPAIRASRLDPVDALRYE